MVGFHGERTPSPGGELTPRLVRESEFPRDLDERMEAILSAFNAGPKTTLALILSDSFMPVDYIVTSLREKLAASRMPLLEQKTIIGYCRTLCNAGLVAEEAFIDSFGKEVPVAFRLTKDGKEYGQPAAAIIFSSERRSKRSFYRTFGQTAKSEIGEHRASLTRNKILRVLREGGKSVKQLSMMINIPMPIVSNAVNSLKKTEFAIQQDQVEFYLRRKDDVYVEPVRHQRALTDMVVAICRVLGKGDISITQANVFDRLPDNYKNRLNKKYLRIRISEILAGLVSQKFLRKGRLSADQRTLVSLTRRGRKLVDTLIIPLEDILSNSEALQRTREEILPQVMKKLSVYATSSTNDYYPHSHSFMIRQREQRLFRLFSALHEAGPGGISSNALMTLLGEDRSTVHGVLNSLVRQHRVRKEKRGGKNYYFPLPDHSPDRSMSA